MTKREWSGAGYLMEARSGHNAIFDGRFLIVVGGDGKKKTEKCSLTNGEFACTSQAPELNEFVDYPELFLIPFGFCSDLH